jgi:hypothetical protein
MKLKQWLKRHRSQDYVLVYSVIALAILLPMLRPGYILTLDMVFTPELPLPSYVSSEYLLRALLHVLNFVLPSEVIQKLLLFAILLLSGTGMHRLMQQLRPAKAEQTDGEVWGTYLAGTLYMINPFTYSRFMAGQYGVLLGYALLPFFVRSLLRFLINPGARSALAVALWVIAISVVSIHSIGLVLILGAAATSLYIWRYRGRHAHVQAIFKYGLLGLATLLIASSYWLVPFMQGKSPAARAVEHFGVGDQQAFATVGGSTIGRLGNVVRLQGFWAEDRGQYLLPQDNLPAWGLIGLVLWALVALGAQAMWRRWKRSEVILFVACAILGTLLAIGIWSEWLNAHLPFFSGYREPHKFVGLIALSYAVLAGQGTIDILRRYKERSRVLAANVSTAALLLIPVMFTPTMPWGFVGQLTPRHYPPEWFAMNKLLSQDDEHFQTLFLPWHLYMHFDFAGRIIANPAPAFFDKPMIISDDPEFKDATPVAPDPKKAALGRILNKANQHDDLGQRLAPFDIKYIVLAKETDADTYGYIDHQKDVSLEFETASLRLYHNEAFGEK